MLNYLDIALKKIEDLSEIVFLSDKNESLKKLLISLILEEIKDNSSIQIIVEAKNNEAILELLNELLTELKDLKNLKKIENLEKELINNLDENSYSELIKLKTQLNRE